MTTLYTIHPADNMRASVFGPARVPIDSRYSSAAELCQAIRAAAADAPESAAPRVARSFPDGAYAAGPSERILSDCGRTYWGQPWHGPIMPEPAQPDVIRVEFHFTANGARSSITAANLRPDLLRLADRVHAARNLYDGRVKRAPRPSKPASSARHVTARALWDSGDRAGALTIARNVGAVFFGSASSPKPGAVATESMPYMVAEHSRAAGEDWIIARAIQTGKFRVLHLETARAADDDGFSSSAAAIAWLEERAQCEDWQAKLRAAIAKAPKFDQASALAHYPEDSTDDDPSQAAPEPAATTAADEIECSAKPESATPGDAIPVPLDTHSDPAPTRPTYADSYRAWQDVESGRAERARELKAAAEHERTATAADPYASDTHERPCAAPGLTSYRARGAFGWIMIGATDDADAMREARRSTHAPTDLQRWNGSAYVPCNPEPLPTATHSDPVPSADPLPVESAPTQPVGATIAAEYRATAQHFRDRANSEQEHAPTFERMAERFEDMAHTADPLPQDTGPDDAKPRRSRSTMHAPKRQPCRYALIDGSGEIVNWSTGIGGRNKLRRQAAEYSEHPGALFTVRKATREERDAWSDAKRHARHEDSGPAAQPVPGDSAPVARLEHSMRIVQTLLDAMRRATPGIAPAASALRSEAARVQRTGEEMRSRAPQYAADCRMAASALRDMAEHAEATRAATGAAIIAQDLTLDEAASLCAHVEGGGSVDAWVKPGSPIDDDTAPAPLDGLDVADLGADGLAEFERAGGTLPEPTAPAYSDTPRTAGPSLRIPATDPRTRIPARFAPVYCLRA